MKEQDELTAAFWWKASASGDSGGCVEFARLTVGGAVRDSKNIAGGALRADAEGMNGLVLSAKSGAG